MLARYDDRPDGRMDLDEFGMLVTDLEAGLVRSTPSVQPLSPTKQSKPAPPPAPPPPAAPPRPEPAAAPSAEPEWTCAVCTLLNAEAFLACDACGTPRPST